MEEKNNEIDEFYGKFIIEIICVEKVELENYDFYNCFEDIEYNFEVIFNKFVDFE